MFKTTNYTLLITTVDLASGSADLNQAQMMATELMQPSVVNWRVDWGPAVGLAAGWVTG
jgi:hypothetical protein